MKNVTTGFTLVETMLVITVSGIMLGLAMPSFRDVVYNSRLTGETNRLISDINLARSEALKRNAPIVLCRTSDPNAATPSCGGTANIWDTGWLVFSSGDGNLTYDTASDQLIRVSQSAPGYLAITSNATANATLVFNPDATTSQGGNTVRFALCDSRGASHGKQVEVPPVGRARLADSVVSCSNPS